jgi:hypothetical protein
MKRYHYFSLNNFDPLYNNQRNTIGSYKSGLRNEPGYLFKGIQRQAFLLGVKRLSEYQKAHHPEPNYNLFGKTSNYPIEAQ